MDMPSSVDLANRELVLFEDLGTFLAGANASCNAEARMVAMSRLPPATVGGAAMNIKDRPPAL
jgi:hypothetical protein